MSNILLTWLNTEVDLSKRVNKLERDFSNGYLLGELLYKFNQLTNLNEFKDKNDRDSKLHNFKILQEVLNNIGVNFNSQIASDIINQKDGKILSLLYEIRSKLEKKGVNPENLTLKKSAHFQEMYSPMKFSRKIPQYDNMAQKFFIERLQQKTKAQKEINMENQLAKFEMFKKEQDSRIKAQIEFEEELKKIMVLERAKRMRNNMQRNHTFIQQFEQKGIQDWKLNMLNTKEMTKRDVDFQLKEAVKYKTILQNTIRKAEEDANRKIDYFEKNILGKETEDVDDDEADTNYPRNEFSRTNSFNNEKLSRLAEAMKGKIYEKIMNDLTTKTERIRRRRKIIVEQSKAQLEIENRRREEQYVSKLYKQSNQEKQITYEGYRVSQTKSIIIENRRLRDEMYVERKAMDVDFLQKNEEEFLKLHKEKFQVDLEKEHLRQKDLQIALMQKKRSVNSDLCKQMVDLIVDIAEEAFIYQQVNDSEEIDPRVWREWTNIFINDESVKNKSEETGENIVTNPIEGFNQSSTNYKNTFYSILSNDQQYSVLDKIMDDCEFLDYINYVGQWYSNDLIPETAYIQINPAELNIDLDINKNDKTRKNINPTKPNEEFKETDIDNLVIPRMNVQNTFFGDLIDILTEMRYDETVDENEEQGNRLTELLNSSKSIFNYIPIKLSLIGRDFAGKKTQAKILSENFPFKIYQIENLVLEAIDMVEKYSDVDNTREIEDFGIHKERKLEAEKFTNLRNVARKVQDYLLRGEAIPDEIYVDLIVEFIKIDFPKKSEEEILIEIIDRVNKKEEILEELEKNNLDKVKRPKTFAKVEQDLTQQLLKISLEASKGFVIVNFPNTYNQAKLLERKLSNYIPPNERAKSPAQMMKEKFSVVLEKSPRPIIIQELERGGMDFIFYLDVPSHECIRRAIGRRCAIDEKGNEVIYHLEDNPPVTTSNICERLTLTNSESTLVTRHLAFDTSIEHIKEFYSSFGFKKQQMSMFQIIDGNKTKDFVTLDLISYLNQLVSYNEELDKEIALAQEHSFALSDNNNISNEDNIQHGSQMVSQVMNKEDGNINTDNQIVQSSTNEIKTLLNKDLAEILFKIWNKIFENYLTECKSIFKFLRVQRDSISTYYNVLSQKFIDFLKRPSKKQILLLDFQLKYNKFLDDYPDLKDDPVVKEEHHQEVDDLSDKIYEIIENRKNESVEERKKIMTSGWIENEMEKFYLVLERLYQNEIDKFLGSLQIIRDYYHNLDNRPLIELPFTTLELIKEDVDQVPLEEGESAHPRIEKLYKQALRIQFQYDEALVQAEKRRQEKLQDEQKKKPKVSMVKKEENVQITYPHEEEMKSALKNEKSKYRYRATLLKHWGVKYLDYLRKIANTIHGKLDDWIILAINAENEALVQLTAYLKTHIENEKKVKYEVELDTFDLIINMDVQNYIELPEKPLPAKEVIDHLKFNIKQLQILLEELRTYVLPFTDNIRTSTFVDIFIKKFISAKTENDAYYGIPELLKKLSYYNYYKMIKCLDPDNSDVINIKYVGTYFALLNCRVCTEEDEQYIRNQMESITNSTEGKMLTEREFVSISFWFDSYEESVTLKNHENFNRVEKLKKILFDIHKDNEEINMNDFIDIISLKAIGIDPDRTSGKTYYDALFF